MPDGSNYLAPVSASPRVCGLMIKTCRMMAEQSRDSTTREAWLCEAELWAAARGGALATVLGPPL